MSEDDIARKALAVTRMQFATEGFGRAGQPLDAERCRRAMAEL